MRDGTDNGAVVGGIFALVLLLIVILFIIHACLWGAKIGLPDNSKLLEITIHTESSAESIVYGTDYKFLKDEYGNDIVVVTDCYEAKLFHYIYTAKQKSFYGNLVKVEHYNDNYYIPSDK